jgi:hypothetical protein
MIAVLVATVQSRTRLGAAVPARAAARQPLFCLPGSVSASIGPIVTPSPVTYFAALFPLS